MSDTFPFERALKEAKAKLAEALEERLALERRIVSLKQSIEGLSALCEPQEHESVKVKGMHGLNFTTSLTDAIRSVFSKSSEPILTPTEVRDALLQMGVDLKKYKQQLVPIHNTLKRLESQGEIVAFRDEADDLRGYRWISPLARAVAEVETGSSLKDRMLQWQPRLGYPDPLNKRKK